MKTRKKERVYLRPGDALIVVDLQNDFCAGGSLAVPGGDEIVPVVNSLIEKFSKIPSRFFQGTVSAVGLTKDLHMDDHDGWPLHCVRGTRGAEFHPDLQVPKNAPVFGKGMKSHEGAYSGFEGRMLHPATQMPFGFGNDVSMEDWLQVVGSRRVFITGLATNYCVKATVLDALNLEFVDDVYVVTDAIAAVNLKPGDGEKALQEMVREGAILCASGDILHEEGCGCEDCDYGH